MAVGSSSQSPGSRYTHCVVRSRAPDDAELVTVESTSYDSDLPSLSTGVARNQFHECFGFDPSASSSSAVVDESFGALPHHTYFPRSRTPQT
ncbi:hypothetical protein CCACVL1_08660 [Corchorus capsularis]|uniref:Uncharacterized protein n=1 Tax=Corchorus capsularis TaxID=210143 RepID=A0A1R3IZF7_COCAP|nr:hypothetical protein CCACVL1_08660 [Corchorus capsularis]